MNNQVWGIRKGFKLNLVRSELCDSSVFGKEHSAEASEELGKEPSDPKLPTKPPENPGPETLTLNSAPQSHEPFNPEP